MTGKIETLTSTLWREPYHKRLQQDPNHQPVEQMPHEMRACAEARAERQVDAAENQRGKERKRDGEDIMPCRVLAQLGEPGEDLERYERGRVL
ncbi:MAG: hypothetical protein COA47_17965 [Robiginitomaculum sp.]|nr:MAG: hypothetical protein COA47_17965 [Robiginitomaculum sp.]